MGLGGEDEEEGKTRKRGRQREGESGRKNAGFDLRSVAQSAPNEHEFGEGWLTEHTEHTEGRRFGGFRVFGGQPDWFESVNAR